jgi:hypothetical protein
MANALAPRSRLYVDLGRPGGTYANFVQNVGGTAQQPGRSQPGGQQPSGGQQTGGATSTPWADLMGAFSGPSMYDFNAPAGGSDFLSGGGGGGAGTAGAADPAAQERLLRMIFSNNAAEWAAKERIAAMNSPAATANAASFAADPVSWQSRMGDVGTMQRAQDIMARGSGFTPQDVQDIAEARANLTPSERDMVRGMPPTEAWRKILSLRHAATPKSYT